MSHIVSEEDYEEMLAAYMDSFSNPKTFQADCDDLQRLWRRDRERFPSKRLLDRPPPNSTARTERSSR